MIKKYLEKMRSVLTEEEMDSIKIMSVDEGIDTSTYLNGSARSVAVALLGIAESMVRGGDITPKNIVDMITKWFSKRDD